MDRNKLYQKGYLPVSDGHKLYYEACGNPKGKPVLFLHGGPGAGFSDKSKRFFDPKIWNIILFDQRGAGRSTPFASLKANTTQKLVNDITKILDFFRIEKTLLFGGSWGSTLALMYGIENPGRVNGMLLRGIYLGTRSELQYYLGGGVKTFAPEAWERFISHVPKEHRKTPWRYYLEKMQSQNAKIKEKYTYEFAYYELSIIQMKPTEAKIQEYLKGISYKSMSPLEVYYLTHNCFIPDNYILNKAHRLSHIPISIVQGKYDLICPPIYAYLLHKKLKNSTLHFVTAGHAASEKEIEKKLIAEMKRFAR